MIKFSDGMSTLYEGDCREELLALPAASVQVVVTSPPYWGQRRYDIPDSVWDSEPGSCCEHEWASTGGPAMKTPNGQRGSLAEGDYRYHPRITVDSIFCQKCGAWRGQFGQEPTPEMYVQHTIEILAGIWRVLRPDGVVFWNVDDTKWAGKGRSGECSPEHQSKRWVKGESMNRGCCNTIASGLLPGKQGSHPFIKPKDFCLIPERIMIAAQEAGWGINSKIIWSKPNCMPESVRDRPTHMWEHVIMLTKSRRHYWDQEGVREPARSWGTRNRDKYRGGTSDPLVAHKGFKHDTDPNGRNIRDVWTIATATNQNKRKEHFSPYPEALAAICIKAATPEAGACSKCGAPCVRLVERAGQLKGDKERIEAMAARGVPRSSANLYRGTETGHTVSWQWQPGCACGAPTEPARVLDPFAGTGTTMKVAKALGRYAIGIEIGSSYSDLVVERVRQDAMPILSK